MLASRRFDLELQKGELQKGGQTMAWFELRIGASASLALLPPIFQLAPLKPEKGTMMTVLREDK
jgi:hypothetical protein